MPWEELTGDTDAFSVKKTTQRPLDIVEIPSVFRMSEAWRSFLHPKKNFTHHWDF